MSRAWGHRSSPSALRIIWSESSLTPTPTPATCSHQKFLRNRLLRQLSALRESKQTQSWKKTNFKDVPRQLSGPCSPHRDSHRYSSSLPVGGFWRSVLRQPARPWLRRFAKTQNDFQIIRMTARRPLSIKAGPSAASWVLTLSCLRECDGQDESKTLENR